MELLRTHAAGAPPARPGLSPKRFLSSVEKCAELLGRQTGAPSRGDYNPDPTPRARMLIRLTRLTNERHRFEIVRDDGTREAHEMETRSTLAHDLAHYAVELEAGLRRSFYGRLARGTRYVELTAMPPEDPEVMETERVVVMLQGAFKSVDPAKSDPQHALAKFAASFPEKSAGRPAWLTGESMARMVERLRRVHGQWRATPFHQTLELKFP